MKKKFYYLSLMLGLVFGMVSFTSCGGDDDDDTPTIARLNGIYEGNGVYKNVEWTFVFDFDGNGKVDWTAYAYDDNHTKQMVRHYSNCAYWFSNDPGDMYIQGSDSYTHWKVSNLTDKSFNLHQMEWDVTFSMTRTGNSAIRGKSGGSSSGSGSGSGSGGGSDYDGDDDSGYSGGSGSSSRTKCKYCNAHGTCDNYGSSYSSRYCHGDKKCWKCDGKGYYYDMALSSNVGCSYCDTSGSGATVNGDLKPGDGVCPKCHGSGKCQNCGGSGYVD